MIDGVRGEDEPNPDEIDWVDAGDVLACPPRPHRPWRLGWVALAAAVIPFIVVLATHSGGGMRRDQPTSRPSSLVRPSTAPTSAALRSTATPAVTVTEVGHPLAGITASWDLYARGTGAMLRIELARGRITRTVLPALASSGPVSFRAAPHAAIIRPLDFVPGYLVPDGRPPRALTGALASGGVLLPGPVSGQFWMQTGEGGSAPMVLVGADGHPIKAPHSARIAIPPTMQSWPAPDGAGYLLLTGVGGAYDLRPAGLHRITTGAVLAIGPTRWLAAECNQQARCSLVVIDQASGSRQLLRGLTGNPASVSGVISPDGHTGALLVPRSTGGGSPLLHLVDLSTGTDRRIALQFRQDTSAFPDGPLVWSPDSRWLFATDIHGQLYAVDTRTGREQSLGASLPPVVQLAIR